MNKMTYLSALLFALMLPPVDDAHAEIYLRPFGLATTVDFCLYNPTATDLMTTASFAAGEVKIMKDEGAEANTTNLPTDRGNCYSLVLTAAEMTAKRVMVQFIDTATKTWLDKTMIIETEPVTTANLGAMTGSGAVTVYNAAIVGTATNAVTTAVQIPPNFRVGNLWLNTDYLSGTGTTLSVTLQISPDGTNFVDYTTFTTVGTADAVERIPVTTALFRWVRLKYTSAGTSPNYQGVLMQLWGEPK